MKKTLLIYISIFYSFFIFSQKKDKIETIEMNLIYNNTTYIGTYIGNIEKIKKNKFPEGSGNFKGVKEGSEPKVQLSYFGGWKEGSFSGNGTLVIADTTFTGNFTDSKLTGIGKAWWKSNGFYYEGEFQNNRGNGTGKINTNSYEYNGSVTNFLANGIGKIIYKSKISEHGNIGKIWSPPTYTGAFKDGNIFGTGTLIHANGDTLTGIWNGLKFTGNGKLTLADGSIYNGDWVNGEKNGPGKLIMKNGNIYDGDWKDDVKNGKGKFTWVNGDIYEGDWVNGEKNGSGKLIMKNGNIYDGDWKDDVRNGKGKYTWINGDIYDGDWKDDKRNGKGKYTWVDGNIFEGDWKDDKRNGKGKYTWVNGDLYEGDWKDDKKNGEGKLIWASGDVYNGSWLLGIKSGQGEMSYKNGTSYSGEWANDLPNGQGEFLQTDGKVLNGKFINGVFQKPYLCKEVEIGNQVWMAENLTVAKFRNGDLIPQVKTLEEFKKVSGPAWCYYEFSESNGLKYGKLYNWYAVNDPRGLAPIGWRIPKTDDFWLLLEFSPLNKSNLEKFGYKYSPISSEFRSKIGWGNIGTNTSGFNALPAGKMVYNEVYDHGLFLKKPIFTGNGKETHYWTSQAENNEEAYTFQVEENTAYPETLTYKYLYYSVRCIKE